MLDIETFFNTEDIKRFYFPGKIFWGRNCRHPLFDLIPPDGQIALFVDVLFAENDFVREFEGRFGRRVVLFEKIRCMPEAADVRRMIGCLKKMPEVIISLGGGSTIDTAKAVMAGILYGMFEGVGIGTKRGMKPVENTAKPVYISLPTTAGTGADASRYFVVYDDESRGKIFGRSWNFTADWILLDPAFVRNSSDRLLISSAFDAFVHFFETFLCRHERSWYGEMLSLDGMVRILDSLDRIVCQKNRDDELFLELLYASTLAGTAISNVRTGMIHEAAGALLEHTEMTHPDTLFVFLRPVWEQYHEHISDREKMLVKRLDSDCPHFGFDSFERIVQWWEGLYTLSGLTQKISGEMGKSRISPEALKQAIFTRVFSDKVWIEKECPFFLGEAAIRSLIESALARFGL